MDFIRLVMSCWGGVYERIIRCVTRCSKKLLARNTVTYEQLQTILSGTELVLNNSSLTFTYKNPNDTVVTANHLFLPFVSNAPFSTL